MQSCSTNTDLTENLSARIVTVTDDGTTTIDIEGIQSVYFEVTTTELTDPLADWLKFMVEEEKLARDAYLTLYETFHVPIFRNIPKAELNHMNAVLALMNSYGIDDPSSAEIGIFTNPELQGLYDQLVEKGKESLVEALKVGALIEETDIVDLADVYELNPGDDFKALAEALMLGSRNHLRAFNRVLKIYGVTLTASVLDEETFNDIVTTEWERGTGYCHGVSTSAGSQFSGKYRGFRFWKG